MNVRSLTKETVNIQDSKQLCVHKGKYMFNSPTHCMPHTMMLWHVTHIPWSLYRAPYNHCHALRVVYDAWEKAAFGTIAHCTQFGYICKMVPHTEQSVQGKT